jgi:putative ABC transport system permease protein
MEVWIGAVNLGFLYAFMAMGAFITYKYYSFPDITIDGSFTTGAAIGSILIVQGWNPLLTIPVAFVAGALAGLFTGLIHTKFKVEGLLSGILVMTGLYSVNLHIMGKSNISLLDHPSLITLFASLNPGFPAELWTGVLFFSVMILFWLLMSFFLKSDFGLTMRATGNNPVMVAAQGVSVDRMKIFGISFSNGLAGMSGALIAQYQGFADIGMGIGSIIYSLAAVTIGQALFPGRRVMVMVLGVITGTVIFRLAVALALMIGLDPNDLKILTALFVLLTLVGSQMLSNGSSMKGPIPDFIRKYQKSILALIFLAILLLVGFMAYKRFHAPAWEKKIPVIGLILANQSDILTVTRDGFRDEMKRLGYTDGLDCIILEQNAEGDIPTNKTIVEQYISSGVDIFVPISTASTQAVANKVKDKPVVFATVASPFIIGVGVAPDNHPPNITGVYGSAPIRELLGMVTAIFPGNQRIGTIYNHAFPNTRANLGDLRQALLSFPQLTLEEMSVSSTSEVQQAAQALASKKIRAFILINDLTVSDAIGSVIRVARQKSIPVFSTDAGCFEKGPLMVCGYEYYVSGQQAAHLVHRILSGESPARIPYELYKHQVIGLNFDLQEKMGIRIPAEVLQKVDATIRNGILTKTPFLLNDSLTLKP